MLTKSSKEFEKDNVKEVARYKWDQPKYDPNAETFSDILERLQVITKQAFQENAGQYIQLYSLESRQQQSSRNSWTKQGGCQPPWDQDLPA